MQNPVAWQTWGPEALALAKRENRMLFLSVGYAACHCESYVGFVGVRVATVLALWFSTCL